MCVPRSVHFLSISFYFSPADNGWCFPRVKDAFVLPRPAVFMVYDTHEAAGVESTRFHCHELEYIVREYPK